jgi:hypothetical protein
VQQSRFLNRREDRHWITSPEWRALFLAALTELTPGTAVDVAVVTGLPVAFYSDKEQVQQHVRGEHRVQREGRRTQPLRVTNARVIPQPFGSPLTAVLDDRGHIHRPDLAQAAVGQLARDPENRFVLCDGKFGDGLFGTAREREELRAVETMIEECEEEAVTLSTALEKGGSLGFCRATPSASLKVAKNCVFVGITDLFRVVNGLWVGMV